MDHQVNNPDLRAETGRSPKQLAAARQVAAAMSMSFKNFSLYPATHSICIQSLRNFNTRLQVYLETYGDLRFEVRDQTFCMGDEEVHRDNDEKDPLAALFYRDGIKWFALQEGIDLDEICKIMTVLKMNRVQQEETTGDIVTALWEINLVHLDYEAVDFMSDTDEIIDPIDLKSVPDDAVVQPGEVPPAGKKEGAEAGFADYDKISLQLRQRYDMELNAAEEEDLRQMVREEEGKNIGQEALEILLIILDEQEDEGDFRAVLSFVKEEFLSDLGIGEFKDMCNLLTRLRKYQVKYREDKPWASKLIARFFQEISTADTVESLAEVLAGYDDPRLKASLTSMARLLQLMSPVVIPGLAALLTRGYSDLVEMPLLTAIKSLAERDAGSLVKILPAGEPLMVMKLIPVIGSLQKEGGVDLLEILVDHQDAQVRIRALEKFISQGKKINGRHYNLVDDPNPTVRQLTLKLLGSERSELVESFLLNYLENELYSLDDDNHLLACYRALGSCGSGRSIPYLVNTLTEGAWKDFLGMDNKVLRHAAAWALLLLDNPAAKKVLRDGSAGKSPAVKEACDMVLGKKQ